jgi:AbiTii
MPVSKTEQIITLALEVLEDAEMLHTSVESLVLKTSRLARLVGDEDATLWLSYERLGYITDGEEISYKYMSLTHRWINFETKSGYWGSISFQEGILELAQEELKAARQPIPSGELASYNFNQQQQTIANIINKMGAARNIVSSVRGQIQEFATRIYHERLFSAQAETIFEQYRNEVDLLLASTAERAFVRLPQAFERLSTDEGEAVSHALTTCRRVIDSFADAVFPARAEPLLIGQQPTDVGAKQVRNRLRAYIYKIIGRCARYERLNKSLGSLYDRVSAGVHADVDAGEARALVLQTYLFLGEVLSLQLRATVEGGTKPAPPVC